MMARSSTRLDAGVEGARARGGCRRRATTQANPVAWFAIWRVAGFGRPLHRSKELYADCRDTPALVPVPPSGYGGIEWVVSLLADGLIDRGHEVTLFAPPGSETEAQLG